MADADLIKRIVEGEFPVFGTDHKNEINIKFIANVSNSALDVTSIILSSPDDLSRVTIFKRYFEWVPYLENDVNLYRKSSNTSSILREIGKAAYAQKNLKEALKYYNLAIAFAPHNPTSNQNPKMITKTSEGLNVHSEKSECELNELIMSLAERSSILLQVRGGEEALRDVNFIFKLLENIKSDKANELRQELEERKLKCEKFIEEKASFMLDLAKDSLEEMDKRQKYKNLLLFKIKKPNPKLPAAEHFIDIKIDPVKGRKLVVNRDIPAGTTIAVEEPFAKVLKNGLKWDMNHCHYCFTKIRGGGGIPCPGCVFEIYCAESCKDAAFSKYHKFECPCMAYLHYTSSPRFVQIAFRIICTVGPKELYRIWITKDEKYFIKNRTPRNNVKDKPITNNSNDCNNDIILGANPVNQVYDSQSYLPIFHLISHSLNVQAGNNEIDDVGYVTNVIQSLMYATILEKLSPFFDQVNYDSCFPQEYFKTFIASMILRHLENIPCNSISVDELVGLEGISLLVKEPTILQERIAAMKFPQYGTASYALSSMINHSCDPNVTRVHDLNNARMALVSMKGLKKGEELLTTYTKIFLSDTVEERKAYLQATYNFTCDCVACIQKWPILAKISESEPRFSCSNCTPKFTTSEKATPAFARCILDKKGHCRNCKKTTDMLELRDQLDIKIESFFEAYELVLKNKPLDAIRLLGKCMQFFQDNVCPPYNKIYMCQDLLKNLLELIVYYSVPRT